MAAKELDSFMEIKDLPLVPAQSDANFGCLFPREK